jgi:ribonuclease BN (tRNA processing enzyme)
VAGLYPPLTVTFAGSGDAFGSGGRLQACIVLRAGQGAPVLLDCGASSLIALKRQGIEPNDVTAVFVSHLHVDHFGGVPHLILDGQFRRRTAPLTVAGPAGTGQRLRDSLEVMFPGSSGVRRRFDVRVVELDPDAPARSIDGTTVQAYGVDHGTQGGPFLALRLTVAGKVVAYTGDTAWTDVLLEVAAGADLFIAESYYWDKPVPFHLRHCDLLDHRDRITSARTVLTHMSDDMLARAADSPFDLAHDGLSVPA